MNVHVQVTCKFRSWSIWTQKLEGTYIIWKYNFEIVVSSYDGFQLKTCEKMQIGNCLSL